MSTSILQVQNEVVLTEITPENCDHYDTVYIGYPIRWGIAVWPVNQFVTGKAVIPLLSLLSVPDRVRSDALRSEAAGTGAWLEGSRFSYDTEEADMQSWVNSLADAIAQTVKEN